MPRPFGNAGRFSFSHTYDIQLGKDSFLCLGNMVVDAAAMLEAQEQKVRCLDGVEEAMMTCLQVAVLRAEVASLQQGVNEPKAQA